MARFLLRVVINAVAIWLTTFIVAGVDVTPYPPGDMLAVVLTAIAVAAAHLTDNLTAIVNGIGDTELIASVDAFQLHHAIGLGPDECPASAWCLAVTHYHAVFIDIVWHAAAEKVVEDPEID